MARKTPMLPKPEDQLKPSLIPAITVAVVVVTAIIIGGNLFQTPAQMTIDRTPAPAFAPPTHAVPTAAPKATSQPTPVPFETVTPAPPPVQVEPVAPAPVVEEAAPIEVPLTPLVFRQGVCAEWHAPMAKIAGCP